MNLNQSNFNDKPEHYKWHLKSQGLKNYWVKMLILY